MVCGRAARLTRPPIPTSHDSHDPSCSLENSSVLPHSSPLQHVPLSERTSSKKDWERAFSRCVRKAPAVSGRGMSQRRRRAYLRKANPCHRLREHRSAWMIQRPAVKQHEVRNAGADCETCTFSGKSCQTSSCIPGLLVGRRRMPDRPRSAGYGRLSVKWQPDYPGITRPAPMIETSEAATPGVATRA